MNTVALKNAAGKTKMVVLADEAGKPLRMSKAEATMLAAKTENGAVASDNFTSTPVFDKRTRTTKYVYNTYFVRIKG